LCHSRSPAPDSSCRGVHCAALFWTCTTPARISAVGTPAGTLWVARSEQEYRLIEIAILPEFRNRKIGATILKYFIEEAARKGKPVIASVGKSNSGSIRFHTNLGFKIRGDDGVYLRIEFQPPSVHL
jgi:ribosomal protein S18 acetylase RimI-like enzyme